MLQIINAQKFVALYGWEYTGGPFVYCPWCGSELFEIDPEQAWFWTEEWQKGELEAEEDLREGRYTEYTSMDDFIASLYNSDE